MPLSWPRRLPFLWALAPVIANAAQSSSASCCQPLRGVGKWHGPYLPRPYLPRTLPRRWHHARVEAAGTRRRELAARGVALPSHLMSWLLLGRRAATWGEGSGLPPRGEVAQCGSRVTPEYMNMENRFPPRPGGGRRLAVLS